MAIETTSIVKDLALGVPGATRLFESLGIDYCCNGARPLAQACGEAGIAVDTVVQTLRQAAPKKRPTNVTGAANRSPHSLHLFLIRITNLTARSWIASNPFLPKSLPFIASLILKSLRFNVCS